MLGTHLMAMLARMTRSSLLEVLGEDYVRTARAKGLSSTVVILRHALRNALVPVITVAGIQFGSLLAGAVVTEKVFARPGIGTLFDVNIKRQGYSRRAAELEIVGSNGTKILKGGAIRSALRLKEQLFVINKRYSGSQVTSYTFTGRGWGHGVGMCQFGAYGMAKMGLKYDEILKHYYTGVELSKAY